VVHLTVALIGVFYNPAVTSQTLSPSLPLAQAIQLHVRMARPSQLRAVIPVLSWDVVISGSDV